MRGSSVAGNPAFVSGALDDDARALCSHMRRLRAYADLRWQNENACAIIGTAKKNRHGTEERDMSAFVIAVVLIASIAYAFIATS